MTTVYMIFLATWARRLSWTETARDHVTLKHRTAATIKIALFHALGRLPVPEIAHRFA